MKILFRILIYTIIIGVLIYCLITFVIPPTIISDFKKSWNESPAKEKLTNLVSEVENHLPELSITKFMPNTKEKSIKEKEIGQGNERKLKGKGKEAGKEIGQGNERKAGIEIGDAPCGWMEVAAMQKDADENDNKFITHYVSDYKSRTGAKVRNYSMNYSNKHLVAHWVAYPLCRYYTTKNTERNKKWSNMFDPKVARSKQQHLRSGYGKNSGFDRGHQLSSADRVASKEMNMQTFYYTNMTPQIGLRLNRGIWRMLEENVRTWSNKPGVDTLYVITGCVVDDNCTKYPDNDNKAVSVPYGYYKVLLSYHKNSPKLGYSNGSYKGCAIYYDNKEYTRKPQTSDLMSISALEEKIGIDFFVNLPKAIGVQKAQSVENRLEKSFWTF